MCIKSYISYRSEGVSPSTDTIFREPRLNKFLATHHIIIITYLTLGYKEQFFEYRYLTLNTFKVSSVTCRSMSIERVRVKTTGENIFKSQMQSLSNYRCKTFQTTGAKIFKLQVQNFSKHRCKAFQTTDAKFFKPEVQNISNHRCKTFQTTGSKPFKPQGQNVSNRRFKSSKPQV